jgi:creatinine amidohydrolase
MIMFLKSARALSFALSTLIGALAAAPSFAAPPSSVYIEELTSPELQDSIANGYTTVLVPIGGTEQNGPYMALGKHNVRAHVLAGAIARQLGNAVVAPVIAYVPEGSIHPPAGHMKYAGTISIPDSVFEGLLEATARSFKQHGYRNVVFLGDHGGYQSSETRVAARLDREWAQDPTCRVHAMLAYYDATQTDFVQILKARGFMPAEIGVHAGVADTSLLLATDPSLVRADALAHAPAPKRGDGLNGDPRRSSAELGRLGVQRIVERTVAAIREAVKPR